MQFIALYILLESVMQFAEEIKQTQYDWKYIYKKAYQFNLRRISFFKKIFLVMNTYIRTYSRPALVNRMRGSSISFGNRVRDTLNQLSKK